ncbi:MAG TPA: response regulator [Patescibacteria group bacterium]|nr:response regulator [Patescibacteria group bacterium]
MGDTKKLLLIEDEIFIRDLYQKELSRNGYAIVTADDGLEGVKKAVEETPDLILLDIMLPIKNGIEVLKELKKHPSTKHIPVLLLTNLGQESIIREAFSLGAEGFLLKSELVPKQILQELNDFFSGKKTKESYLREFGAE